MKLEIPIGRSIWTVEVNPATQVRLQSPESGVAITNPKQALMKSLDNPLRFETLKRALTPDDRVAVIIDDQLPFLSELITGLLEYLSGCGIEPSRVTVISPFGSSQLWIDTLPDVWADVVAEVHDPADRQKQCYLATTEAGRRVYLNRTVIDADAVIILSGRGYSSLLGYSGAEGLIYPNLTDNETLSSLYGQLSSETVSNRTLVAQQESQEISWLLGCPFLIQVIVGEGDTLTDIISGLLETSRDGEQLLNKRWASTIPQKVDAVIATLSGDANLHGFAQLSQAALNASRLLNANGKLILLTESDTSLSEGAEIFRRVDEPIEALQQALRSKVHDFEAVFQWARACTDAQIYLASEIRPDIVEEIFATPIGSPRDVERLLEGCSSWAYLPDAHKSQVVVKP
ncbi:MAG: lactate racemase domain-containing protein [Gemmataceae bacterium]|jgi:nickel-dependent lactate racemase|nr:lactate racemase domain-containing protein [Gemmataceae bacterium]